MDIQAVDFVYDTDIISKRQFNEHIKLYKGYVNKTNEITKELKTKPDENDANATYSKFRGLKKGETISIDGVVLHELYFQSLNKQDSAPSKKMQDILKESFGGFDNWANDFKACAKSARGWCVLSYEQRTASFRNFLYDLHDYGVVCMAYPIIVLDMYEHAYFMDYGTNKDAYIDIFIKSVNWGVIEKRLDKVLNTLQ